MMVVPKNYAMAHQTEHVFKPGQGYIHLGPLPMPGTQIRGAHACLPSEGTADGSVHLLRTPGEEAEMRFAWVAKEQAWKPLPQKGHRLAFSAAYLAAHGWAYAGAVS